MKTEKEREREREREKEIETESFKQSIKVNEFTQFRQRH